MDQIVAQFGEQHVAAFFLVLARISPLFVLAPLFSSPILPARVRGIVLVRARSHGLESAPAWRRDAWLGTIGRPQAPLFTRTTGRCG